MDMRASVGDNNSKAFNSFKDCIHAGIYTNNTVFLIEIRPVVLELKRFLL
jgi:hypothetical protein